MMKLVEDPHENEIAITSRNGLCDISRQHGMNERICDFFGEYNSYGGGIDIVWERMFKDS